MCRTGGRRCPGCESTEARAAHNDRRRRNREIKAAIVKEAGRRGAAPEVIEELKKGSPENAKKWAQANDLPSHVHPGRGHTHLELPPLDNAPAEPAGAGKGPRPADADEVNAWVARQGQKDVRARRGGHHDAPRPDRRAGRPRAGRPDPRPEPGPTATPAWSTPELDRQIAMAQQTSGEQRDEKNLLGGRPTSVETFGTGTNETRKVRLSNGVVGYHKPFAELDHDLAKGFGHDSAQQGMHEVAAWKVAEKMGEPWDQMVPPVVLREVNGEMGSFALERPGAPGARPDASPEWRDAAFFDALIGQQDRHPGNYLTSGDRLTLIDHGYSFARQGDFTNWSFFVRARTKNGMDDTTGRLTGKEIDIIDRLLADETRFGLKGVIEPDRLESLERRARRMRETGWVFAGL